MIYEDFFYRKLGTSQFVHDNSALNRKVVPVRLKNEYYDKDYFFDLEKKTWSEDSSSPRAGENVELSDDLLIECAEAAKCPSEMGFQKSIAFEDNLYENPSFCIETFYPEQVKNYFEYRRQYKRYRVNLKNTKDDNGFAKDRFAFTVTTDDENLILKIKIHDLIEKGKGGEVLSENLPSVCCETLVFDMKKGTVKIERFPQWNSYDAFNEVQSFPFDKQRSEYFSSEKYLFPIFSGVVDELSKYEIPDDILSFAFSKLLYLASKFTGVPLENYENREKPENYKLTLRKLYCLVKIPCEPELFEILCKDYFLKKKIKIERKDTEVIKKILKTFRMKDCKTFRKAYIKDPNNLLTYILIKNAGFSDINLYQRVFDTRYANNIFNGSESLRFFVKYSKARRGEVCTMNTLLKNCLRDDTWIVTDGVLMFKEYFSQIPEELKKDILHNGFSEFNHDALENLEFKKQYKNFAFKYTGEQRRYECVIDGYQFLLPKDAYELCDLGTVMHNCVATYANKVKDKDCTIVYAKKDENPVLCIEVRKNEVWQERADHNTKPNDEEFDVLSKWHKRNGLIVL